MKFCFSWPHLYNTYHSGAWILDQKNALAVHRDDDEVLNNCRQGLEIKPSSYLLLAKQKPHCASVTENFKDLLGLHLCSWVHWWKTKQCADSKGLRIIFTKNLSSQTLMSLDMYLEEKWKIISPRWWCEEDTLEGVPGPGNVGDISMIWTYPLLINCSFDDGISYKWQDLFLCRYLLSQDQAKKNPVWWIVTPLSKTLQEE